MQIDQQTYFDEQESFMTVRHLTMRGTNYEIGQVLGRLAVERYHKSPADTIADPIYARARRLYLQRNYPIHWERVRGVAAAFAAL